ncbi:MAG: GspE/PulE family protein [Elusimicrobiota bacterium]
MPIEPLRKKYIGEILLNQGVITEEQLERALNEQKNTNEKLGQILLRYGYVDDTDILKALAFQFGLPYRRLKGMKIDDELRKIIPESMARKLDIVPVSKEDMTLTVAMSNPADLIIIDEIESKTDLKISVVLASKEDIEKTIDSYYGGFAGVKDLPDDMVEEVKEEEELPEGEYEAEDAPIVKYVNSIFVEAVNKGASDIHIEPLESSVSLRMRIDGKLKKFPAPPKKSLSAIVSRIKIMANLNIAEKRVPQDGKCKIKIKGRKIDIRVSTLPTIYGEKVVMRILDKSSVSLIIDDLGFTSKDAQAYKKSLSSPYGMILVTGPTGSGKTTTLYAGLNFINQPQRNLVTAEDPVEYELDYVNQVQVKPIIDLTFANILRSVLRQDPDVIMVGEIRDKETAEIAVQSALTGHLVMSTLHTNDAISSLSRMRYMGIEPYLIADAVDLVIAQRLVRKICPNCKEEQEVSPKLIQRLGLSEEKGIKFYHGKGCDECFNTGYKGRTAIFEIVTLSKEIKSMVVDEISDIKIKEKAIEQGMETLRQRALEKLKQGITTVEEVLTVTFGEGADERK